MTAWPDSIARQAAVLNRLADGMAALRDRHITGGELDEIIAECGDSTAAIERDSDKAWLLGCQTRAAVREGRASWA